MYCKKCLGLTAGETLLVVTDDDKKELGEPIYEAGKALGAEAAILTMKVRSKSGEEPPAPVAEAMLRSSVVVCVTRYSLTHIPMPVSRRQPLVLAWRRCLA